MNSVLIKQKLWYSVIQVIPIYILMILILSLSLIFLTEYINYILIIIVLLFGYAIYKFAYQRSFKYLISKDKIKHQYGVILSKTDFIELYRVKDYGITRNIFDKMVGTMSVTLHTSDKTHPEFKMKGLPNSDLTEKLRILVEQARQKKNVYEID